MIYFMLRGKGSCHLLAHLHFGPITSLIGNLSFGTLSLIIYSDYIPNTVEILNPPNNLLKEPVNLSNSGNHTR